MTPDEITRAAREAGFTTAHEVWPQEFKRFAALVAAAEREACAKVCEDGGRDATGRIHVQAWGAAKAIRARGESK